MALFFICEIGNTRVIKQASLQKFQEEMDKVMKDPYKVVMKQSKLPMSLLHDRIQPHVRGSAVLVVGVCGPALGRYHCLPLAFISSSGSFMRLGSLLCHPLCELSLAQEVQHCVDPTKLYSET